MPEPLDADLIHRSLSDIARRDLDSLDVLDVVPSTNTWLMQQPHEAGRFRAVLAEHQTAGRGRNSRRWFSPPQAGLCLSLSYTFARSPANISCLTLAAGVAVTRALDAIGARDLQLKWPNDIYAGDAKLGGILVDAQSTPGGHITLVCGVGINVDLSIVTSEEPLPLSEYTITDLHSHARQLPGRSKIAAAIIDRLVKSFNVFAKDGLEPFRADWNRLDWLKNKQVHVELPDGSLAGTADGIDANGALRVLTEHGRRRVYTGTVRLASELSAQP